MIKVKVENSKISIRGHADYDTLGKDIVCASVSSIVTTSVNGILSLNSDAIEYKSDEGLVIIDIIESDETTKVLLDNMVNLLTDLSKDYPKNIKVERE